ncbi:MAG: spermidine/putrescine ABC transporter substrate-binding protein [Clostridiales bacterium]|nr:MAG: spermidine/putrescine ABC transporter substrate-binding protein [Clostridiales bacterium]
MKKVLSAITTAVIAAVLLSVGISAQVAVDDESYYAAFRDKGITLNVYNWGEYISDGTDGSLDIIEEFENISGITVNYTLFDTNEDMYAKLAHGGSQYDIIIPSDYMIARLIDEDMLEKIDYNNIPNIKYIDDKYRYTDFDPNAEYSVPYTWGMVGLVYNTKYVTAEEASSWDVLWNEKFKGKVLMFGNSRDAFAIALKKLGYSLNTENLDEITEASEALTAQKEVNQAYAMDQTFDKMANENAYAAPYYAGDCLTMMERNSDLAFSYPKEGVNRFIDSICIPKGTQNKQAAEAFINFLCETEVAVANCEYISYFTPHTVAAEQLGVDERIYPSDEVISNSETFVMLGDEANALMEDLWLKIRSTSSFDSTIFPLAIIIILALVIFVILYVVRKRKKSKIDY